MGGWWGGACAWSRLKEQGRGVYDRLWSGGEGIHREIGGRRQRGKWEVRAVERESCSKEVKKGH